MSNTNPKLKGFLGWLLSKFTRPSVEESKPRELSETEKLLKGIDPSKARENHATIRNIFLREMDCRRRNAESDHYESLYLCAFLIYKIGDLDDVEMMWEAKNINQDTGAMLDIQYLVGAGVENTFSHLEIRKLDDILEYLSRCREAGDFDDLSKWEAYQMKYFYGPQ